MKILILSIYLTIYSSLANCIGFNKEHMKEDRINPKRVGPEDVQSVTINGIRYETLHWGKERGLGQNGGCVVAIKDGKEVGLFKIYTIKYDHNMEEDVQDNFITDIQKKGDLLIITNEHNEKFTLNIGVKEYGKASIFSGFRFW